MRLTCPNCGAQYEVPDDIIPTAGRDVQCSNCGNTWFQTHPDHPVELEATQEESIPTETPSGEDGDAEPVEDAPEAEPFEEIEPPEISISPETAEDLSAEEEADSDDIDLGGTDWDLETDEAWTEPDAAEVAARSAQKPDDEDFYEDLEDEAAEDEHTSEETSEDEDEQRDPAQTSADRPRRGLDADVADILREEAAYEFQARAAEEPQSLETQGDLGLDDAGHDDTPEASDPVAARVDRLRGQEQPKLRKAKVKDRRSTRRDLLPDIEEINSTLRSTEMPKRKADPRKAVDERLRRGRGFRLGFCVVLMLAAAAIFVYSSHDTLSLRYPEAAPFIEGFMASANDTRIWLDDKVTQLFLKLNEMTG